MIGTGTYAIWELTTRHHPNRKNMYRPISPQIKVKSGSLRPENLPFDKTLRQIRINGNTTIGQLPSFAYQVEDNTIVQQVEENLRANPRLPGVIITRGYHLAGILSRRQVFELLGTRYGVAVYLQRPISVMARHKAEMLVLPESSKIDEAVNRALQRDEAFAYEPLLIEFNSRDFRLLDIYTLLLAQSQLFAKIQNDLSAINQELENRVTVRTEELSEVNKHLQFEIVERKQIAQDLQIRFRYEQALAKAANTLLAAGDEAEVIPVTLEYLLEATGVSRVYLSENMWLEGQGQSLRLLHQACVTGIHGIPPEYAVLPYDHYREWMDILWSGEPLIGHTSHIHSYNRQLLEKLRIKSFLLLPIGEPGSWYGMIGLDETSHERSWSEMDVQLLQTVAQMIYTHIERQRSRKALSQAKDEAIKASQFKTELLAKVNHELRTPMGAIMGYAQLLQVGSYGELTEEQLHPVALILSSTNYLNVLVSTLLDQAQIEKGTFVFQRAPFDVHILVAEVDARMRVLAEKTGLEFVVTIEPGFPPELIGDRLRVQQIWSNLLSNALKFTEQGGIHSTIRTHDSDYWVLDVTDTGIGIPKDVQPHIFDAFVQVDGSPTRKHTGIGLGLSIVSQLIELMNGRMTLHSEVGKGTTFTVFLPYTLADQVQP